jgi:hypothetical protein
MDGVKKKINWILLLLGWLPWTLGVIGALYVGVYCRFKYPDLTETRLLLDNWDTTLLAALFIFVGSITFNAKRK